jgi:hypothetical protein
MTQDPGSSNSGPDRRTPLLTLEPLIEAIREGVSDTGWALSGLQKTTSHEFEGRWAGDSSRSAYLFFHRSDLEGDLSVDVYLDEGPRGLSGNLALVVDGRDLAELPEASLLLQSMSEVAAHHLLPDYQIPISFRVRVDPRKVRGVAEAEPELRFKIRIPKAALRAGEDAVASLAAAAVHSFERLLADPVIESFRLPPSEAD